MISGHLALALGNSALIRGRQLKGRIRESGTAPASPTHRRDTRLGAKARTHEHRVDTQAQVVAIRADRPSGALGGVPAVPEGQGPSCDVWAVPGVKGTARVLSFWLVPSAWSQAPVPPATPLGRRTLREQGRPQTRQDSRNRDSLLPSPLFLKKHLLGQALNIHWPCCPAA